MGSIDRCFPRVLHIFGRSSGRENSDIVGEYVQRGAVYGRPIYRQQGSTTVIRYWPPSRRWLIDREGLRESDVCVAFAAESLDLPHPAHPELIWCVWQSTAQAHVPDTEVIAVSGPRCVTIVGRAGGREKDLVNGQYHFSNVVHGRPMYIHSRGDLGLRYVKEEHRWIIVVVGQDSYCIAFSEAAFFEDPGHIELEWMFWEPTEGRFCLDPDTRAVVAPAVVHMMGRRAEAENSRINGSYLLAGIMEGRPAYVQPGTKHLIRYSSRTDRWLLDPDGLVEPSLASRLYYWIFRGDLSAAGDRCAAFSEASGSAHPGVSLLEWFVWESRRSCFVLDQGVRCTTAPSSIQVVGRSLNRENEFINGDYILAGVCCGRVFYQRPGTQIVIRFWPSRSCWLVDGNGLQQADACSAFADCLPDSEFPGDVCSPWYVYESTRGAHFADLSVTVLPGYSSDGQLHDGTFSTSPSRFLDEAKDISSLRLSSVLRHAQRRKCVL
ncbi:unnamed protein product [Durusdinium trenchii]|uniref:Uncharacterized protein n=1 Tax=Durusdinium trenchii TaxID=1381693 RepID=A0ABP0J0K6_9DINO